MTNYERHFGSPAITAMTIERDGLANVFDICDFDTCPRYTSGCEDSKGVCPLDTYEGILEWLNQEAR